MSKQEFTVAGTYHYDRRSAVRWIASHLWRARFTLVLWVVTAIATNLLFDLVPAQTGKAFDIVLRHGPNPLGGLIQVALVILALVVGTGIVNITARFAAVILANRFSRDARDELYLSLLGKSQTFHNRQRVGDIMARANNDISTLVDMVNFGFDLILDSMSSLIIPIVYIGLINPWLLIAPMCFLITYYFALRQYTRELNPVSALRRMRFGVMNAGLAETIRGIEVVKSSAEEAQEARKFLTNARSYRDAFVKSGQIQSRYLPPLFLALALVGAFAQGIILLQNGTISIGALVAFMGLMALLRFPSFISIFTFLLVELGVAGSDRILEIMRQETELDENAGGHVGAIRGEIVFDHVTFSYGNVPVLRDLSFTAHPGQIVAIVGQTGAGKSTLMKLVNRTYDVESGRILVDGVDVRDWNLNALRSQISTIEQDIFLFSRSIADNIAFGMGPEVTREAIEQTAHDAQADGFIHDFAEGYETMVGERGVTLSGGQRQRLAIARALLTDPRILMLDDSTSAIDSATEDDIQRAIRRVLEGRTTLLVTHRISQIRRADEILVLQRGALVDQGTHAELLARCALYRRIFIRQAGDEDTKGHEALTKSHEEGRNDMRSFVSLRDPS